MNLVASAKGIGKSIAGELDAPLQDTAEKTGKKTGMTLGTAVAGAFAVVGAAGLVKGFVGAASDLNETISKSNTVFGENGRTIEQWASGAAKNLGQSKQEALDAASTFGNMFVQLGIGTDVAAGMSTQMVGLASDFASFHNAAPTDVIDAMTSAFRGEYDALQRYVPTISAATVEQKALEQTGKKTTKELTAQEKAVATQALILENAGDAAGDFARTSDSLANQQRILSAQWQNMQASLGQKLLPVVVAVAGFILNDFIPAITAVSNWVRGNWEYIVAALAGITAGLIAWGVSAFATAVANGTLATSFIGVAVATIAAAAPFIAIGVAVAALVAGVIWAYQNWDVFRNTVNAVKDAVQWFWSNVIQPFADWLANNFVEILTIVGRVLLAMLSGGMSEVAIAVIQHWDDIKGAFEAARSFIADKVGAVIGVVKGIIGAVAEVYVNVISTFGDMMDFIGGLPDRVAELATRMWNGFKDGVHDAVEWALQQLDRLLGPLDNIVGKVSGFVGKIGGAVGKIPGLATGGTLKGLGVVGEDGPELMYTPRPMSVLSNDLSRRMLSDAAPSGGDAQRVYQLTAVTTPTADVAGQFRKMELLDGLLA